MKVVVQVIEGPHTGEEFAFERPAAVVVGRSTRAQISMPNDRFLSRNHFLIEVQADGCVLRDLGSTNETRLNGGRVGTARLADGDVIGAGKTTFVVRVGTPEAGSRTCPGCGVPVARRASAVDDRADEYEGLFCDDCAESRKRFPAAPAGYWIERRLGGGGMGEVYLARSEADRRRVALKTMIAAAPGGDRSRDYFRREIAVLQSLRHPNIVAYYGVVEDDDSFHLVMEYVDGPNARDWVAGLGRPLELPVAARVGVQLLMALDHAHNRGFVHRDVKPSNLLISGPADRPTVRLTDFGLAKSFRDGPGIVGITREGDIGGSVGFVSPDAIRDFREVKEASDVYSAGATLYYLLTRQYPFLNFDPRRADAYAVILEHPAVPLRAHRPDVPDAFDRVLAKALEKRPKDRWKSAAAMADALRPFLDPDPRDAPADLDATA